MGIFYLAKFWKGIMLFMTDIVIFLFLYILRIYVITLEFMLCSAVKDSMSIDWVKYQLITLT